MILHVYIESGIDAYKKERGQFTNEHHFIEQYVRHLADGVRNENIDIVDVGGKDRLSMFDNQMKDYKRQGDQNIVIFDCDYAAIGGGIAKRRLDFDLLKREKKIDFDYFLFPNNNDEGTFENLLLHIVNKDHLGILDCFSKYEQCVESQNRMKGGNCYEVPNTKAKIYSYITSFKMRNNVRSLIKAGDWQFYNTEYWNLDDPYLEPLKSFLLKYLRSI